MSSADGPDGPDPGTGKSVDGQLLARVDMLLIEGLIHALIEKGVLTKNDALSVVQTAAQVKRGTLDESRPDGARIEAELAALHNLYRSFEAMSDHPGVIQFDGENIHRLRPPLHGDRPEFPRDD